MRRSGASLRVEFIGPIILAMRTFSEGIWSAVRSVHSAVEYSLMNGVQWASAGGAGRGRRRLRCPGSLGRVLSLHHILDRRVVRRSQPAGGKKTSVRTSMLCRGGALSANGLSNEVWNESRARPSLALSYTRISSASSVSISEK